MKVSEALLKAKLLYVVKVTFLYIIILRWAMVSWPLFLPTIQYISYDGKSCLVTLAMREVL